MLEIYLLILHFYELFWVKTRDQVWMCALPAMLEHKHAQQEEHPAHGKDPMIIAYWGKTDTL